MTAVVNLRTVESQPKVGKDDETDNSSVSSDSVLGFRKMYWCLLISIIVILIIIIIIIPSVILGTAGSASDTSTTDTTSTTTTKKPTVTTTEKTTTTTSKPTTPIPYSGGKEIFPLFVLRQLKEKSSFPPEPPTKTTATLPATHHLYLVI